MAGFLDKAKRAVSGASAKAKGLATEHRDKLDGEADDESTGDGTTDGTR